MSRPTSSVPSRKRVEPPSAQTGGPRKASRILLDGRMGGDHVGEYRRQHQDRDDDEARDGAPDSRVK